MNDRDGPQPLVPEPKRKLIARDRDGLFKKRGIWQYRILINVSLPPSWLSRCAAWRSERPHERGLLRRQPR